MNHHTGLSVVIATLGDVWVERTIDSLLNSSVIPDEILICIPDDREANVAHLRTDVVKVILTGVKGQVKQRAVGFRRARHSLVMQLDDDILLEKETISKLVTDIQQLGKGNVISPVYYGKKTGKCIHQLPTGMLKNVFDVIICDAKWGKQKMGTVTPTGINYGVDDMLCKTELMQTQWLPGGCVLSFREDLIMDDFFPFEGKAYCEDIFHSFYRKQEKIKMWVASRVKVFIDEPEPEFSKNAVEKVIRIRRKYLSLINGPQWRLFLYELFCRIRSKVYER
jgi:glycosyltransferase involved in cell wall biosynthesis